MHACKLLGPRYLRRSMNDLQFDVVREADATCLLTMARAFHSEDGHPLTPDGEAAVEQIARGDPLARGWIITESGQMIGYVVLTLGYSIEHGGRDGFIDDLYLVPQARGSGRGRRVLAFALAEAAALGIRTLHLEVEIGNERARRVYQAAGFLENNRRLMSKRLCSQGSAEPALGENPASGR
jgi:ribosomal protein S18 acetylase RimI-like enzyme